MKKARKALPTLSAWEGRPEYEWVVRAASAGCAARAVRDERAAHRVLGVASLAIRPFWSG